MAIPGTSTKTINDLIPDVIDALQQRTDVASLVPKYLKRAIEEVTESYPFEELRRTGPTVQLTPNQAIYPLTFFLPSGIDYSFLEALVVYVNPPTNTSDFTLKYKTPKAIEPMLSPSTRGIPAFWTRFGINLHLGPVPALTYSMFARYQMKHPFPDDNAALATAPLFIPSTWEEIVVYSAASRIAFIKRWSDQRQQLHDMLYGDPEFITSEGKKGRPGIIAARLFQVERDQKFDTRSLGIVQSRYTSR